MDNRRVPSPIITTIHVLQDRDMSWKRLNIVIYELLISVVSIDDNKMSTDTGSTKKENLFGDNFFNNVNSGAILSEEVLFIPHRVFVNHLDSYHGRQIANILSDKLFHAGHGDAAEELDEEMVEEEQESRTKLATSAVEQIKYEIVGTVKNVHYKQTEGITAILYEGDETDFMKEVMKCGFIVYDITIDAGEIPKALDTLQAVVRKLDELKEQSPKKFKNNKDQRVFVLISTVMTWAKTKPVDPDDPDVPFVETDYRRRKPHPNYKSHIDLEKEVIQMGKKFKDKLHTIVIACGLTYGADEEDLHYLFKMAWQNEPELPIIQPGNNTIPLLNVKDLVSILFGILEDVPRKRKYILAVEQTLSKQKQIVKVVNKSMGNAFEKIVSKEEALLYPEMSQVIHERMTVNLKMEPNFIVNEMDLQWQSELNFCENIEKIVKEFKESRKLQPIKILIHGPPAVGKTEVAKKLSELYSLHYISVESLINDKLATLRANIEYAKLQMSVKEPKEDNEDGEKSEENEEEEEESEDFEGTLREMQDKLKELLRGLDEGRDGKLPDTVVIQLLREKLSSNPCQNQGYMLDGYPKTMEQTREIFELEEDQAVEEEEEEIEEEEEDGEKDIKKLILPDFVITLEASDEFLYKRVMSMPESKIQGTHYTEEQMVRRTNEFRANNTEENTLLNVFDEIDVHPIVVDAETDDQDAILALLKHKIGEAKGYPPSAWEIEQKRFEEEELMFKQQGEASKIKEAREQKAREDKERNMERWMDMLQRVQQEEQEMLTAQCMPLRDYLMKFVFPTLTRGLLETARVKPDDPVDFLAEFLFKENPEGRMFDPSYTAAGEDLLKIVEEFQEQLGI